MPIHNRKWTLSALWRLGVMLAVVWGLSLAWGAGAHAADSVIAASPATETVTAETVENVLQAVQVQELPPFVPGQITVGVGADWVIPADQQLFGLAVLDSYPMTAPAAVAEGSDVTVQTLLLATAPGTELAEIERIGQVPGVHFALPNWTARAAYAETSRPVSDPLYRDEQWYLQRIQATRGWALAESVVGNLDQLARVRVAVIDSGVDFAHPDLAGRILSGWDYISPGTAPQDEYGHGSHMTGLIAARFDDGRGMVGLAPAVEILPYRVLDATGGGAMVNVASAIRAAVDAEARIINLSLFLEQTHPLLEDAVGYAHARGVLIVASAGNCVLGQACPGPVRYPAAYPQTLAVGASTLHDTRAYYSAMGDALDLVAPGGDVSARILSVWPAAQSLSCGEGTFRMLANQSYCLAVGTSSAAALVSGAAALVWSVQPQLSAEAVRNLLLDSAHPLPFAANEVGVGRLDLRTALYMLVQGDLRAIPDRMLHTVRIPGAGGARSGATNLHHEANPSQTDTVVLQTLAPPPQVVTRTLLLENPSLMPVTWQATLQGAGNWVQIAGPSQGQARFGAPGVISLVFNTTSNMQGRFSASLRLLGVRRDGSSIVQTVPIQLDVLGATQHVTYLPRAVARPLTGLAVEQPFVWYVPAPGEQRTVYGLSEDSSALISLPFPITVLGRTFTDFRLASDGYISLPGSENPPAHGAGGTPATADLAAPTAAPTVAPAAIQAHVNQCLNNLIRPSHVLAAWWADLDPGALGSQVSAFVTGSGDFVVEFANVPLRDWPEQRVSFQIVLTSRGTVRYHYRDLPPLGTVSPTQAGADATVGLAVQYGRFYRQLYCRNAQTHLGTPPFSRQAFEFSLADFD